MTRKACWSVLCAIAVLTGCSKTEQKPQEKAQPVSYFKVDPGTAGIVTGAVSYKGKRPPKKPIDMSSDPACVEAHHSKAYDESLVASANGGLANVFVYIKTGLEGKTFETPSAPAVIDQRGCWFRPRILGIQTSQTLRVINSDPVTHNIHPLAQINREWNHSQGQGDPPLSRRFIKPEVMIRIKCNIHSWMRAYIGVVAHPYFAVTDDDGAFQIRNLPPGDYVLEAWHELLGVQDQPVKITPSGQVEVKFKFQGD